MSKGDRHRSINPEFKSNYDKIDWGDRKTKYANKRKAPPKQLHHIMTDIEPYKVVAGPRAGEYITSRSEHRAYLKQHKFEEVGNEKDYFFSNQGKTDYNPTKGWEK